MHIYDWLESEEANKLPLIKEFFDRYSKPAYKKYKDGDDIWLQNNPIFCVYQGKKYRCTGCSRFGDVWLTLDFSKSIGYSLRVDFNDCSDWTNESCPQDKLKSLFEVITCCHGTPAIEIHDASKKLHSFLCSVVSNNWIDDEEYKVSKGSGAFIQGGSHLEEGWILIEFWRPEGVQAFVDFITKKWEENKE